MVKLPPFWTNSADQETNRGSNRYTIADLIEHSKDLPVLEIPLAGLNLNRDLGEMNLFTFARHAKQSADSDLQYPIILDECGCILDGAHRVIKALLAGHETIKAVRFELDPHASYIRD